MANSVDANLLKQGHAVVLDNDVIVTLVKQTDLDDLIEMLADERVTEYLFFAPSPVEVYHQYFQPIIDQCAEAQDQAVWPSDLLLVARNGEGDFIGMAGLTPVAFHEGNFEVGFQLPYASWGRGLATRLATVLIDIAFSELNAHKVTADCYAQNVGSYRALQKSGLSEEGRQTDYYKLADGYDDKLHMGVSRSQWNRKT
jgi:RimJ/RimL family protein N-acetyltransferase